jgi:DNA-binding LytR/AlgR family response regulator
VKLSICDDELVSYECLKKMVTFWAQERLEPLELQYYTSAEELLFKKEEWADCDGLLLDIELKTMNGMQLAKEIRRFDEKIPILFVTGYEQFVFEGYDVGAVSYLLKPVNEKKLVEALERMLEMSHKNKDLIFIEGKDSCEKVYLTEIVYVESDRHNSIVQTTKDEMIATQGISHFWERLKEKGFCMPHRSYLVNISRIRKITKEVVVMDGGYEIPIARGKWELVNQRYLDYYRDSRRV